MKRFGLPLLSLLTVSSAVAIFAGCSKDPPPAQNPQAMNGQYQYPPGQQPYPQGQYPQGQQYPQQPQGQYPQTQPTGAYPQPGPTGQPTAAPGPSVPGFPPSQPPASGGGSAQAIDPNLAAAAAAPLQVFANTEAPGMTKEGAPVAGNFQTGQTLEGQFSFQPGKCYTVVAAGVGITELDLEMQYVTPIPGVNPSISRDSQKGAQASIGGKGNCLKPLSPFPANAKFIVKATSGAGMAVAQLYVK